MSRNIFTDKENFKTIDSVRIVYLLVAIAWFFITETGRFVYRPYIYRNHINDFGIADSIGNLGGIIVQIFAMLTFFNPPNNKAFRVILFLVVGYIVYEIIQPYLPRGVFDWLDVYGTIIGGAIASVFYLLIIKVIKNNKVFFKF